MTFQSLGEVKLTSIHPSNGHEYDIEEKMQRTFHLLLKWGIIKPITISQIVFLELCFKNIIQDNLFSAAIVRNWDILNFGKQKKSQIIFLRHTSRNTIWDLVINFIIHHARSVKKI